MDETNTTLKRNAADLAKLRIKYASGIDWTWIFWHFLNVIDKTHAHYKFLLF